MSRGVIMRRRQKCFLHPFYRAAQRHHPKSYRAGDWYHQGNSQQQLLYHGDIAPSVNSAVIFDAPTPCCGANYRCRAAPSVNVALKYLIVPNMRQQCTCRCWLWWDSQVGHISSNVTFLSNWCIWSDNDLLPDSTKPLPDPSTNMSPKLV